MRYLALFVATVAVAIATAATLASSALAKTTCAGGVFTGVNISGGLIVAGDCVFNDSTITGGVTVTSTGGFEIENSSVSGGIVVEPGGELDVDHVLNSDMTTGNHSSISGGITTSDAFDVDIYGATVTGTTTLVGGGAVGSPQICGSTLASLNLSELRPTLFAVHVGDPGEPFAVGSVPDCPANTLTGSLTVTDSSRIEIESNTIGGSVTIKGHDPVTNGSMHIELAGNDIKGSASCSNVTPITDGDHPPNAVGGSNNCP
jgi:hypothetical protein